MAGCCAYATTAGFESVCEAMYLGKPILMIPTHIEQACNAHEAFLAGAGVVSKHFDMDALIESIPHHQANHAFRRWVEQSEQRWMEAFEKHVLTF
jgi:UDP:flavonoid glycosyltransferase YjiC (YdhE family)